MQSRWRSLAYWRNLIVFSLAIPCFFHPNVVWGQDAAPEPSAKEITNSIGMKLVRIPAGRFSMGSPASEPGSEEHEVLHKVELTQDYFMGVTEVTEQQWATVMLPAFTTQTVEKRDPETKRLIKREEVQVREPKLDSQLPMTGISWQEAMEFCRRLGELPEEKKEGRRYRLPTEAEWERACRADTSSAYSFGDDRSKLKEYAWYGGQEAKPVGQLKPNAWGLFDMHGNAAEWCYDYYGAYSEGLVLDPNGPEKLVEFSNTQARVNRGGWFGSRESQCRSGWRGNLSSEVPVKALGFRVALEEQSRIYELVCETNSIGQKLVTIPPGSFVMGTLDGRGDEKPAHEIRISSAFQISSTEVTQEQWMAVMGTTPWKRKWRKIESDSCPVTYVSWEDAVEFCRRLSEMPDEKILGRVYRLPTEAEWEFACRSGGASCYHYGFGEIHLPDFAWYSANSSGYPQPVGGKKANAFGLHDMHGNVWEWCSDWYSEFYYGISPSVNPTGPMAGSGRVIRGGCFEVGASFCRSSIRAFGDAANRSGDTGFRVAVNARESQPTTDSMPKE